MNKLYMHEVALVISRAKEMVAAHPEIRLGQALYNELYQTHPLVAKAICSSEYDPFYQDERINGFLKAITHITPQV